MNIFYHHSKNGPLNNFRNSFFSWFWHLRSFLDFIQKSTFKRARFSKHRPFGPMLSISRFVRPSVCLIVRLFTFEVPFNGLLAPTSRSRMSNIFRDSESLGKSNEKKWSHIWTFLFGSGLKSPRKKKFVFLLILPYKTWWKPRFPMD